MFIAELVFNLLKLRYQLPAHDRWSRSALEAHQARSLCLLRQYAYGHSPFYREFHKGLFDHPLHALPVLTKSLLMDHFDELVTDRSIRLADVEAHLTTISGNERYLDRYWVNATSGSTGNRGYFLFNAREWATVIAGFGRANLWAGFERSLLDRKRIAIIGSSAPWHMSYRIIATIENPWAPMLRLSASQSAGSLVQALNAWKPRILGAYPSVLRVLAGEQLEGHLRIRPDRVYTGGEVLSEETRHLALKAWGTRVFDQYGTTEVGDLASECRHHRGLHISEDLLIVEPVDADYRAAPPGRLADRLLVTVLFNRTQPLIRYEISDRIRLASSPCDCGKPYALIDSIQGRAEEMLNFPALSGGVVAVHPLVFERILDAVPAAEWQVVQEHNRLIVLFGGVKHGFPVEMVSGPLRRELAAQGAVAPEIEVSRVSAIPRGLTGKAPIVKRSERP